MPLLPFSSHVLFQSFRTGQGQSPPHPSSMEKLFPKVLLGLGMDRCILVYSEELQRGAALGRLLSLWGHPNMKPTGRRPSGHIPKQSLELAHQASLPMAGTQNPIPVMMLIRLMVGEEPL